MKFQCDFELPSLDLSAYQQQVTVLMASVIREAARIWLRVASVVPVWSGESKATFQPLADLVNFPLTIAPARHALRRAGISRDVGELEDSGSFFGFEYATDLKHLIYNEFHNANIDPDPSLFSKLRNPGPYHFQQRAGEAFRAFSLTVRLPDPRNSIRITRLKVR